jgi:hypothetical protein
LELEGKFNLGEPRHKECLDYNEKNLLEELIEVGRDFGLVGNFHMKHGESRDVSSIILSNVYQQHFMAAVGVTLRVEWFL